MSMALLTIKIVLLNFRVCCSVFVSVWCDMTGKPCKLPGINTECEYFKIQSKSTSVRGKRALGFKFFYCGAAYNLLHTLTSTDVGTTMTFVDSN